MTENGNRTFVSMNTRPSSSAASVGVGVTSAGMVMTASAQTFRQSGMEVLAIKVSDLATYPIERPGDPSTWMRVVADVYGFFSFAHWDNHSGPLQPWNQTIVANSGAQCPMTDGWVHPDYPSLQAVPAPGQDGGNPYTPISTAPSALPTAVATSGSACTVDSGST
jgi:hypothetical protein